MAVELRLVRYFVAVAQEGNVTRAAERLHISQPSLSAAVRQLEAQLGVSLLERSGREIALTPAGELLRDRGAELLDHAEDVVAAVRDRAGAAAARLELGLSPTARYGLGPQLLAACAAAVPAAMLYTREDTTGALLRDVARRRLDLAVVFCPPASPPPGVEVRVLRREPAVVHVPDDHPLAARRSVTLADLAGETVLVAASGDSSGFTDLVLGAFAAAGLRPRTLADPYPDLGLQAVREGLGVVVYVRSAFPADLPGSAFVALEPPLPMPFALAWRSGDRRAPLDAVVETALQQGVLPS
jgi:DNA-binding transcriptional LysR family regulator